MPRNQTVKSYVFAVGRRREAVARVRLYNAAKAVINGVGLKKGDIIVNNKPIQEYFRFGPYAPIYNKFILSTGISGKYPLSIKVEGGGLNGQLDAVILGMARVLDKLDREKFHKILRDHGYLTRDARKRERRKVGMGGKARRKKQSPKR
ncbi:MAG: 30S ribosomal protein S9 [Candidatus Levybacteria bacterium]|nr:30S ribosomal protein S9 [Candidatus Levybacteria bacterium]